MTTPGSRAGHTGADGSGPASADQGGTRGPGRPHPSRGRHSADRGGRTPDDPDYEEDVYRDLYRRDDRYPDARSRDDQYRDDQRQEAERYGERPGGYREDGGYQKDDRYRDHQGADRYRDDDDVYNSLYRPEDRPRQPRGYSPRAGRDGRDGRGRRGPEEYPQQSAYRETERYDQPRGYTRTGGYPPTGNYDETDLHPAAPPDDPPRRGTVRRYGAARRDSTDLFPAASQAGAGWIEPDFATGEIAAVEAGWRAGPDQWTIPVRRGRPASQQAPPEAGQAQRDTESAGASITRSSGVMAIGTLASRGTGLLRTLVQAYALGAVGLSVAYNNANTLPNVVYNLVIGGILTSVIVPLLVTAARRDRDRGVGYDQRMFTLVTFALLALTIIATLLAAPLVYLYKGSIKGDELHLMIILAYFFIPQIFFYGVSSLAGAILNARGSFAAPMWTPVVNNIVVIVILLMFMVTSSTTKSNISGSEVMLLGVGTTLGIVAQTIALVPALRQVGFRWRPRTDFRREEVSEIGRMGGWMFGYIAATQVAFLVTTRVANTASGGLGPHSFQNYTAYTYGWQLFQMPYAVVGISVITALLPRMSAHASDGDWDRVRDDFSTGIRLSSAIVVPSSLVLAVLGPAIGEFLLAHGSTSAAAGRYDGLVFALFCLGLLPYMFFQLQLRVFYALHDSRTPAIIGAVTMATNIAVNYIALEVLPARDVVAGLGLGFGLANLVGMIIAGRILSVRLGGLDGPRVTQTLVRMHVATIPAAVFALAVSVMFGALFGTGHLGAFATLLVGGGGALLLYMLFARALRVRELADLTQSVSRRFRR
ncbi:MAG: murein biosynthesis integral membrane protein MurJ [Streptosporangiaceae bacterium]